MFCCTFVVSVLLVFLYLVIGMTRPGTRSRWKVGVEPRSAVLEGDVLPLGQRDGPSVGECVYFYLCA